MLKLVVLNKDATFRLQTSTGLLNLAVLHKDTTLRLLIFFQGVKNRSGWKTFSPTVPVMAAGCKIRSTGQIYASYSFNMAYFTVMV